MFSKTTNDEHRTWTYCRDRCASLKDTSELEWSACLYGCTASKQQEMSRSVRGSLFRLRFMYHQHVHTQKDCVEWCDGVKESPQAEAYMTENPSGTSRDFFFSLCYTNTHVATNYIHFTPTDGEHLLWRATCIESCTSVYKDDVSEL